ncbi:hypothetical protein ATK17_2624 [Branchiibius hedensis]|uniref:MFS transporter n=1 Tax=Branchiibius hedensis TaxID=672460 RepID=A0A2Y9C213_9MICO|nr:MFS transporter [Branchiibius hedensis]PWJ26461.1 hypothetical protein ATK17_2624 [Branchiibius hedensis]SSA35273.1 hypothetical protein SAMN04489750_2624 [Branchiibius hedensis]
MSVAVTPALNRQSFAVYALFLLNGAAFASWASRLPDIRSALGLSLAVVPRQVGYAVCG